MAVTATKPARTESRSVQRPAHSSLAPDSTIEDGATTDTSLLRASITGWCQVTAKALSKVNRRLVPIFFVMVLISYVDRTNLSAAFLINGFRQRLGINEAVYGIGSGAFYAGYMIFMIPSTLILARMTHPPWWLAFINAGWGVAGMMFAVAKGPLPFVVLRFLLGAFEAGSFPGIWVYFARFIPNANLVLPLAVVESAVQFGQFLGPFMALTIFRLDGVFGLAGWQWLFVMEGIPAVALACVIVV